jgi:opacity protein-like surface antigen
MKLRTLLLTTALVASSSAFADAPAPIEKKHTHTHSHAKMEGYYAVVQAGTTFPSKFKTSIGNVKSKSPNFVGGLGVGYQATEFFRGDLMLQYRQFRSKNTNLTIAGLSRATKVKASAWTLMLNGYVDGHNDTIFTPYLMAGIGGGYVPTKVTVTGVGSGKVKSKVNFVWNAGLGVLAKATDQLSFDLGYRYVNFMKIGKTKALPAPVGGKVTVKSLNSHEVSAGLIWHF